MTAGWFGLGNQQRLDPGMVNDRLDSEIEYAVKSKTHLWHSISVHKMSVTALEQMATEPLILDSENLLTLPMLGCYVCETPYERRLLHRKCPGEPKDGGSR